MGVLPEVAHETGRTVADTSVFAWGYASGVVIRAPLLGILSARFARSWFLAGSLTAMAVLTATTALMPMLPTIVGARILSGLPHAAYFGVGAIGTGWSLQGSARPSANPALRGSLRALTSRTLWRNIVVYAFVNAGLFAVVTFTAPIVTEVARLGARGIPVVLAVTGVGMTTGNYVGGALADASRRAALLATFGSAGGAFVVLAVTGLWSGGAFVGFFLAGYALGAVTPFVQVALMRSVPAHPQLGSSMNSMCANAGSVTGAVCASVAIGNTGDYGAAVWVGVMLTGLGFLGVVAMADSGPTGDGAGRSGW